VEDANVFQSTNDVIPTALKVAVMFLLNDLEKKINELRLKVEEQENSHRDSMRMGYTQMQAAIPTSFGRLFSTYNEALSRDWWRVSKCFERIKQVNLGGGAVGTGLAIPRYFIMEATSTLQKLTGLPVTRSENLADATSNLDSFVEVHAILKAHAVNLEKMVGDLRLLASDIVSPQSSVSSRLETADCRLPTADYHQLSLPPRQVGSSIMPGKINPVIPEFVISAAHRIYANDQLITSLCAQGCLELNAYIPAIGCAMIESLKLLIAMDETIRENLVKGLKINGEMSLEQIFFSPSITTALVPFIGYNLASEMAMMMKEKGIDIFQVNAETSMMHPEKLKEIIKPENLLKLGYSLNDIL
ncbi:MAG: lyase family protein, partial [Bacteroidota bacterium]